MPKIETEWQHFKALTADGLYKLPAVSTVDLVVEQRCAYPDLDGLDRQALHLLPRAEGGLADCLRLPPLRLRFGRVAVAAALRRCRVGRGLMREVLPYCSRSLSGTRRCDARERGWLRTMVWRNPIEMGSTDRAGTGIKSDA